MSQKLDKIFMALADQTRRDLVHNLATDEKTVSELAEPFDMSLAAISKHLKVLENAGLLRRRVEGRVHFCSLIPESLTGALDWITIYRKFWLDRLDELDDFISNKNPN